MSTFKRKTSYWKHHLINIQALFPNAAFSSRASFRWKGSCSAKMLTKCYDKPICENPSVDSSRAIRRAHVSGSASFLGFHKQPCSQYFSNILGGSRFRNKRELLTRDGSLAGKGSNSLLWPLRHKTYPGLDTITSVKNRNSFIFHVIHCLQLVGFFPV